LDGVFDRIEHEYVGVIVEQLAGMAEPATPDHLMAIADSEAVARFDVEFFELVAHQGRVAAHRVVIRLQHEGCVSAEATIPARQNVATGYVGAALAGVVEYIALDGEAVDACGLPVGPEAALARAPVVVAALTVGHERLAHFEAEPVRAPRT